MNISTSSDKSLIFFSEIQGNYVFLIFFSAIILDECMNLCMFTCSSSRAFWTERRKNQNFTDLKKSLMIGTFYTCRIILSNYYLIFSSKCMNFKWCLLCTRVMIYLYNFHTLHAWEGFLSTTLLFSFISHRTWKSTWPWKIKKALNVERESWEKLCTVWLLTFCNYLYQKVS